MCWFFQKKLTSVKEIVEKCKNNPKKICNWIEFHISYISDEKNHDINDYWQTPQETLTGKYRDGREGTPYTGDCDDYVVLAQACLKTVGVESFILGVFTPEEYVGDIPSKYKGHAILAFMLNNNWYHFSNWGLKRCWKAKKLEDVAPYVYKKGYWQECWFANGTLNKGKIHLY